MTENTVLVIPGEGQAPSAALPLYIFIELSTVLIHPPEDLIGKKDALCRVDAVKASTSLLD